MEANDNTQGPSFDACSALVADLVANLRPSPTGLASHHEILRQLEHMRPGSIDREHARQQRHRLGLAPLNDLHALDYAEA